MFRNGHNIKHSITLSGHDLIDAEWNDEKQSFKLPASGNISATFGSESWVEITDEPCPPEKQVHRSEL